MDLEGHQALESTTASSLYDDITDAESTGAHRLVHAQGSCNMLRGISQIKYADFTEPRANLHSRRCAFFH